MPRIKLLEKLFGESPFTPLYEHSDLVLRSVIYLRDAFLLFEKKKFKDMERLCNKIIKLESKADYLKRDVRSRVPKKMLLSIDKNDLLFVLKELEKVINKTENCAKLLSLEKKNLVPNHIIKEMKKIVEKDVKIVKALHKLIDSLRILMESTFGKKEVKETLDLISKICSIESEVDDLGFAYLKVLLDTKGISALMIFYITNITRGLIDISNHAENAAKTLRLVIIKRQA